VSDNQGRWFLINASPDLAAQIEANTELQPSSKTSRNTPIAGVLLTNADLDHVLGLFSMREGGPLNIYSTPATRAAVSSSLGVSTILDAFSGTVWHELPTVEFAPIAAGNSGTSDLMYRAIELPGKPPAFARGTGDSGVPALPAQGFDEGAHSVAYQIKDQRTGGRLLVAPDVGGVTDELLDALGDSDVVIFDGTFWSADELSATKSNAPKAGEMGHVTIRDCSINLLRKTAARHKVYIHINNTNPILAADSPERAAVEAAGITVGSDGLEFNL
jgi:pyrroloquinoline quinone biosynthesis protein B